MIGHRRYIMMLVLAGLVLAGMRSAGAGPGMVDEHAVPVVRDKGVYCTLDAATIKRFTGLSGISLVDVWVRYSFAAGAAGKTERVLAGRPTAVDVDKVSEMQVRYLFRLSGDRQGQGPLQVALERRYLDSAGNVLEKTEFSAPGYLTVWSKPDGLEEKVVLSLLTQRRFYAKAPLDPAIGRSAPVIEALEGFLGYPWGIRPAGFADAVHVADMDENLAVYYAETDVWPVVGQSAAAGVQLVFSRQDGFVQARIDVEPGQANAVEKYLFDTLGPPVMIDKRVVNQLPGELQLHWLWRVGRNTEVAFFAGMRGAAVEVSRRGFSLPGTAASFEGRLAAAQLQKADEQQAAGRKLEAAAFYQILLNTRQGQSGDLSAARQRLADLSGLEEYRVPLGVEAGQAFWGIRNSRPVNPGQRWVRVDFGPGFREEMVGRRPAGSGLAVPAAALCRVTAVPETAAFAVIEQVYLDGQGRIVGDRPSGGMRDAVWPADMIKQAVEALVNRRLAIGLSEGAWAPGPADGFVGIPWGADREMVSGIIPTGGVNLSETAVVFTAAASRVWGADVAYTGPGLMVFDKRRGFVGVSFRFDAASYKKVRESLAERLGQPSAEKAGTLTWRIGENTVYVLSFADSGATGVLWVADREYWDAHPVLLQYI